MSPELVAALTWMNVALLVGFAISIVAAFGYLAASLETAGDHEGVVGTWDDRGPSLATRLVTYLLHLEADFGALGTFVQDARTTEGLAAHRRRLEDDPLPLLVDPWGHRRMPTCGR